MRVGIIPEVEFKPVLVVAIVPALVVEIVPDLVVEIVPDLVVEIVPDLVVGIVPDLAKVVAESASTKMIVQETAVTFFIVLLLVT